MFHAFLGKPQRHDKLTIFPILAEEDRTLPYLLLADALEAGVLTVGEKNGGQVPLLVARNDGPKPILVLDGEQLVGARQNRMTNRSILLPPRATTEIPVSCMEQGRWHFVGEHFAPAPQNAPSKVRRRAREAEADASYAAEARSPGTRSSHRDLASAQGRVWDEIRGFGDKLGGVSPTGALDSIFAHRQAEMGVWLAAYPLLPRQMGLVAFLGQAPLGMDAVGSPSLFAGLHRRILTGYVLDALESTEDVEASSPESASAAVAEGFVESMRGAERTPSDSVGMGEYRILRGSALGGELVNGDHLVHLSAFPTEENRHSGTSEVPSGGRGPRAPRGAPIARPSRRKRSF
ncbi:MAG: ARPP-1 family domain-containing protein [Longimicrobiales bacterium]